MSKTLLPGIARLDSYRVSSLGKKPVVLYDNHRWVLPVIKEAQDQGLLPVPCTMAIFDLHHDSREPREEFRNVFIRFRSETGSFHDIVEIVESNLATMDDDWLLAGMEMGIIGEAVIFGVERPWCAARELSDHTGMVHRILLPGLPKSALRYQGDLSDLARSYELQALWDTLGWVRGAEGIFEFAKGREPILLDFDLDCFTVTWRDYVFPWPDEVFEHEFLTPSECFATNGMNGQSFIRGLISKAGVLTVAREPSCCGGGEKSDQILTSLNKYLFDGDFGRSAGFHKPYARY